jgi:quercetin dioxygenase-like cupin family protein
MTQDWKPTPIRRVITGHEADGTATVIIDDIAANIKSTRPNQYSTLMWCTDSAPADMPVGRDAEDMGARILGTYPPANGTRFMIAEYPPGNHPRRHRTETIDYIIVLSGEIDMELDKGETVTLKTGDVMVQRGTYHAWINRGKVPCRMAFVLVDAKPLGIGEALVRDTPYS